MGWFGGGNSSSGNDSSASELRGFDEPSFGSSSGSHDMHATSSSSGGLSDFQEFSLQLQQQMLIQQVITELSHKAFERCCCVQNSSSNHKDSVLTGKEVACVNSITNKWLDANELLAGRLERKQKQAQQQQFG